MPRADASKTFYDPAKKRQILWGWVAEEGSAPHAGEDWSSIQSLPREVRIDPTNETRLMFPAIPELEALRGAAPKPLGRRFGSARSSQAGRRLSCCSVRMCVSARLWPSLRSQPGASLRPWPQSATALPESFCADGSASPCCPAGSPIAIASTALKAGAKVPLKLPAGAAALKGNQMDIEINITADFTKPGVAAGTKPLCR